MMRRIVAVVRRVTEYKIVVTGLVLHHASSAHRGSLTSHKHVAIKTFLSCDHYKNICFNVADSAFYNVHMIRMS